MGIITGILTYFFGFVINLVDSAVTLFLEALGFSIAGFEEFFPLAADFYDVFIGFAVGLLFLQFIFQIFRNFGVMLDMEAEDPLKMTGKVFLFFGMIMFSRSINDLIIKILMGPYDIFLGFDAGLSFSFWDLVDNIFGHVFTFAFMTLIYLIMIIIIGFQFIKFLMEVVERYIVFIFVLYTAPLAYSTGPFKSTAQIFKSWCRMLASQGLLLLLNVWCIKVFLSGLGVFVQNGEADFFYYLLLYAFLKFSQKIDTLLRIIGMNTASTGSTMRSIGSTAAGIALSLRRTGQAVGGVLGGGSKGKKATATGGDGSSSGKDGGGTSSSIMMQKSAKAGLQTAGQTTAGLATGGIATAATKTTHGLGKAVKGVGESLSHGGEGSLGGTEDGIKPIGKSVDSTMNQAKDNFAKDVLSAAKQQLSPEDNQSAGKANENSPHTGTKGIALADGEGNRGKTPQLSAEVKEGIGNLAKGLPHTSLNESTRRYEGGGFKAFTGEDANVIGSSEMIPSDGYQQQSVKMPDGTSSTLYSKGEGDSAQSVTFDSVDNGVITGSISPLSSSTGKLGHAQPFTAVHDTVSGAQQTGSTRVSDGDSGSYYVSSHGDTSMFKPYSSSIHGKTDHGTENTSANRGAVAQISSTLDQNSLASTTSSVAIQGENGTTIPGITKKTTGHHGAEGTAVSGHSMRDALTDTAQHATHSLSQNANENTADTRPSGLRRFSKHNPANFEIFRKEEQNDVESYRKDDGSTNLPNL